METAWGSALLGGGASPALCQTAEATVIQSVPAPFVFGEGWGGGRDKQGPVAAVCVGALGLAIRDQQPAAAAVA